MKRLLIATLALLSSTSLVKADTITYYHNDLQGSPVMATNEQGNVIWREEYKPYGEKFVKSPAAKNDVGYTGHQSEDDIGLVYMQQRWQDPLIGRFYSDDPKGFTPANIQSFNRYAYANNNPYKYVDPNGMFGEAVLAGLETFIAVDAAVPEPSDLAWPKWAGYAAGTAILGGIVWATSSSDSDSSSSSGGDTPTTSDSGEKGNTNPYAGPVSEPVVAVDSKGNAIPVGAGEKIEGSRNGDYQQVKGQDGKATGVRLDRGGHSTHADPKAQAPHAHQPGVTDKDGNPHLPINQ